MLYQSYDEIKLWEIKPKGWLLKQLQLQAKGLTGEIEENWDPLGHNSGWLGGRGENWERGPYYLDGLIPLAFLLDDTNLKLKGQKWIEWMIESQDTEGNFGPENNKDWWPRFVALKVLVQYHEATKDERVIQLMKKYFEYMAKNIDHFPLFSWGKARCADLCYSIIWLYKRTDDESLKLLATKILNQGHDWVWFFEKFPFTQPTHFYYPWESVTTSGKTTTDDTAMQYHFTHVVNVAMGIKYPVMKYFLTGEQRYKQAVISAIDNLKAHHGIANGMFTGDEHLSGIVETQGTELCAVAEYMFSLETALQIFEDNGFIGDILEKIAYNPWPATISKDYTSHQYLQQVNQVEATVAKRNWYNNGDDSNIFGLEPHFGCCTANMHQGWPKLIKSMWKKEGHSTFIACVYGPCQLTQYINGKKIVIDEITNYPFRNTVEFIISTEENQEFEMKLRIPSYCEGAFMQVNGKKIDVSNRIGKYASVKTVFRDGDKIKLTFATKPRLSHWNNNSVAVEYGSLLFALDLKPEWHKIAGKAPFFDYELTSNKRWNYAINLNGDFAVEECEIVENPLDNNYPPIKIHCDASIISSWKKLNAMADVVPMSPVNQEAVEEKIELIPYGSAKLRVTAFPFYN